MPFKKDLKIKPNFTKIIIGLSSPNAILERSYGEVTKPETINYRSYKPERDGLFCERIFGPVKDYECACGKYKRIRYKGIVCDRCGVEVTEKKVRRERMGHIRLVVPIVHIWYFRSLPNKIGYLLGVSGKKLESIIYYERYVVIQPGPIEKYKRLDLITEEEYLETLESLAKDNQYLDDTDPRKFVAKMGGDAVKDLLSRIPLDDLSYDLRAAAANETSQQRKSEALKRLSVVEAFREGNISYENKPEWMVVQYLPVIPPELRPLVPLDGGRFASSDLNDLYRRVIIRNNRLKRLIEIKAPEVILRNEKRMLQEAVDSLFDNTRKSNAVKAEGGRALKSLSDVLKGKQGRFRQNLLGKRVDYSGRSVIVVGPELKIYECGLPKDMAAELFKPFIIRKLMERGIVKTVKSAKKLVDRKEAVIWDILENILKGHPIMLNRAPTLHRLSIQAFQPKLIEGKAIQLHPLVCTAFNADFDGDQMAVHVPLSNAAILEAQMLMLAAHNILNPQNGTAITLPSQDMVLGLYYTTKIRRSTDKVKVQGEGRIFYSPEEVIISYNERQVDLHAWIKVKVDVRNKEGELENKLVETTVGRVLFNQVVPKRVGFINLLLTKKEMRGIVGMIIEQTDIPTAVKFLDDIKNLGFTMAYKAGLSFRLSDVIIPSMKKSVIESTQAEVNEIQFNFENGIITDRERYNQIIDSWQRANFLVMRNLKEELEKDQGGFNPIYMMIHSGARGSDAQVQQLGGMKGLMNKPRKSGSGDERDTVENPIISNLKDGLSVFEYFLSTHGARKGLADTALKTADAGYLTRKLVDVAQDVIITEVDCGTLRGLTVTPLVENDEIVEPLSDRILGRSALEDVLHPVTDELIVAAGDEVTKEVAALIDAAGIESVDIRSVLTCESRRGVCVKCYGRNLATGRMAEKGDALGVIAAQSIGEPGTQLTLRTFHAGGVAGGLASENQLKAKYEGVVEFDGLKKVNHVDDNGEKSFIVTSRMTEMRVVDPKNGKVLQTAHIPYGATIKVEENKKVEKDQPICSWDPYNALFISDETGSIVYDNIIEGITFKERYEEQTGHSEKVIVETKDKTKIPIIKIVNKKGEVLKNYNVPVNTILLVDEGTEVRPGQTIAKIPRILSKMKDITAGLPRVTELFEARNPSNPAVVSEVDGVVEFGAIKRGNREIIVVTKDGTQHKYLAQTTKHILVQEGDFVKAGTPLTDGTVTPGDILAIKGPYAVQEYIVNEIQSVYRQQGVKINDKHIEVIVRQMMRKVEIVDPGDTKFLPEEAAHKFEFIIENEDIYDKKVITNPGDSPNLKAGQIVSLRQIREENSLLKRNAKNPIEFRDAIAATARPLLQGITRAALGTDSWISAASFQETTKVLSSASIRSAVDNLLGLKENVIVGHLIPAGTGLREYENLVVGSKEEYESLMSTRSEDFLDVEDDD